MLAIFSLISAAREWKRRDFLDVHGTDKGKRYAARLRVVSVGIRAAIAATLFVVGLWMVGAFR